MRYRGQRSSARAQLETVIHLVGRGSPAAPCRSMPAGRGKQEVLVLWWRGGRRGAGAGEHVHLLLVPWLTACSHLMWAASRSKHEYRLREIARLSGSSGCVIGGSALAMQLYSPDYVVCDMWNNICHATDLIRGFRVGLLLRFQPRLGHAYFGRAAEVGLGWWRALSLWPLGRLV